MRALVSTKDAGIIIGRGGKNVSDVRERSSARITISEMIPGAVERILTVIGPVDAVAKVRTRCCPARRPRSRKILEETSTANSEVTTTSVRLLVPHSRMGSIIGKGGAKIKEIQEQSGARILASENTLPDSTERTVTVSGVPDAIHIATYHIGRILQDQADAPVHAVLYKPAARGGHPGYGGGTGANAGAGMNPMDPYAAVYAPYAQHGGYVSAPAHRPGAAPGMGQPAAGGASQAQQIFIPNDMVGCIIGRGGCKINEIRQLSGSNIKIAEPHGNAYERLVTITGTPESNQMALYLLYSRLEAEKSRMAAGY
ncbi:MAG: hypothetical protein BJ554DRAFT_3516 [Olpidium bornovanus]|uniref:K Homology domain-containing protein n=1 Tax=Olpidium bornovanus TaxID=278681 RepID=A0A8H8A0A9_9FUNG|nr:MAG: hypothetical protein BJ554DRAFT_3516 [Olpidium bornovanus]